MAIVTINEEVTALQGAALASDFQGARRFCSERCFYDWKTNQFQAFVKDLR